MVYDPSLWTRANGVAEALGLVEEKGRGAQQTTARRDAELPHLVHGQAASAHEPQPPLCVGQQRVLTQSPSPKTERERESARARVCELGTARFRHKNKTRRLARRDRRRRAHAPA